MRRPATAVAAVTSAAAGTAVSARSTRAPATAVSCVRHDRVAAECECAQVVDRAAARGSARSAGPAGAPGAATTADAATTARRRGAERRCAGPEPAESPGSGDAPFAAAATTTAIASANAVAGERDAGQGHAPGADVDRAAARARCGNPGRPRMARATGMARASRSTDIGSVQASPRRPVLAARAVGAGRTAVAITGGRSIGRGHPAVLERHARNREAPTRDHEVTHGVGSVERDGMTTRLDVHNQTSLDRDRAGQHEVRTVGGERDDAAGEDGFAKRRFGTRREHHRARRATVAGALGNPRAGRRGREQRHRHGKCDQLCGCPRQSDWSARPASSCSPRGRPQWPT